MPAYDSVFVKEKTPGVLLSRLEARLRHPFTIDMEYEMNALNELLFALQQENSMAKYMAEVTVLRNMLMVNVGWLDRFDLAKNLSTLLPANSRKAIVAGIESYKKSPIFKAEMEKTANFENRKRMNDLLKGETKPNSNTNWQLTKNFFIRALSEG